MALGPRVQMAATAAGLAQLLMCFGRPPSVLLRPVGPLGRISAHLRPTRRRQHPSPAPEEQFGLTLQFRGKPSLSLADLCQASAQPLLPCLYTAGPY